MSTRKNLTKRCSWKNTAYFTLFIFYIFSFQTVLWAQETTVESSNKKISSASEFIITSSSTDEDINKIVAFYDTEFGISLTIKKIVRNADEEITGIKMVLSNKKGAKQAYNVADEEPIEPVKIYAKRDNAISLVFGFGDMEADVEEADNIEIVEVSSDINAVEDAPQEDIKVVEASEFVSTAQDDITLIRLDRSLDYRKALILLNGYEISAIEMEGINPDNIESVSKSNSPNNDRLVAQFGEKARNGVIEIQTKVALQELNSFQIERLPANFKLDAQNGSFIIHKNSQASDLEFYKRKLAEIGLTLEIADLERNASGSISNLKLKLHDDHQNAKMTDWIVYKNANGIISIVVGRKNGKASVYSQ